MKTLIGKEEFVYTGRGTAALWAILKALNLPSRSVLIPVNVCEVVVAAILKANMKPVYHDVDSIQGNGELTHIQSAFQKDVVILLIVHNYGTPMDIDPIMAWAKDKELFVIEDVCNSLGATYKGVPVGTFGDASIYSFGHAKIVEIGVGGAAMVKDDKLREKVTLTISSLPLFQREHIEADKKFQSRLFSIRKNPELLTPSVYRPLYSDYVNYLLFNIDNTVKEKIDVGLENLESNIRERNEKAMIYRKNLLSPLIQHRKEVHGEVYWRYTFLAPDDKRERVLEEVRARGLPASAWFPPLHILFEENRKSTEFNGAHSFGKRVVNLWVNEEVSYADIKKTIDIILNVLEQ